MPRSDWSKMVSLHRSSEVVLKNERLRPDSVFSLPSVNLPRRERIHHEGKVYTKKEKKTPPLLFPSKYVVLDNKELGISEDALNLTCDLHLCCNDNAVCAARDVQYSHEIPHPLFPYVNYACHVTLTTSYPSLSCFISAVTVWDWLRTCLVVMATSQQGHSHSSNTLCQNLKCRDAS